MGQRAPSHLHPGSAGLQRTVAGISSVSPDEDQDRPFARLHYAVPTAPGPTGTRAEHVTDMLGVPRRIHANCWHASSRHAMAYTHAALLAAQEERQTETRQDG